MYAVVLHVKYLNSGSYQHVQLNGEGCWEILSHCMWWHCPIGSQAAMTGYSNSMLDPKT